MNSFFLEPPQPPQKLTAAEVYGDHVNLKWAPPAFDGGSPVTRYVVECRNKLNTA